VSLSFGQLSAGLNNDCPVSDAPAGVTSLTIHGAQTNNPGWFITLCVTRPDLLAHQPQALGLDVAGSQVHLVDVTGTSTNCAFAIDRARPPTGTASTSGMCGNGGDPAGFALVIDGALALDRVDHVAAGLADLGKSEGILDRQVPRWRALLESYHDYKEWPGPIGIPGITEVADWLTRHIPPRFTPGLLHGDYHLANVMFRNDGAQLAAIVDWELATIGDPLLDMGWIMATWPDRDGHTTSEIGITPWTGFPAIEELIAHYAARSQRDTSQMRWYGVLACYKLGLILEGTYARACAGLASKATGDRLHKSCVKLFQRALGWLDDDRFALI